MNRVEKIPACFLPALERLDGDLGLLRELAAITAEDLPDVKRATEAAVAEGDLRQAAAGLHKLKGMLCTFDSDGITGELQDALDAARRGNLEVLQRCYHDSQPAIEELAAEITQLAGKA